MLNRRSGKTLSIALTVLFTGGLAVEAYGWHECPHHHFDAEAGVEGVEAPAPSAVWDTPAEGDTLPAHGHCSCVGSCHAGAAVPLPGSAPVPAQASGIVAALVASPSDPSILPRRVPYLLPLPNGPPVL